MKSQSTVVRAMIRMMDEIIIIIKINLKSARESSLS